jgi:hypothetical protein
VARGPTLVQSSPSVLPEWLRRLVESVVPNTESQVAATVLILVVLPFPQRELPDRGDGRVEETDSSVDAETGGDDDD